MKQTLLLKTAGLPAVRRRPVGDRGKTKGHVDKQEGNDPPVRTQRASANYGPQFDSIPKNYENGNIARFFLIRVITYLRRCVLRKKNPEIQRRKEQPQPEPIGWGTHLREEYLLFLERSCVPGFSYRVIFGPISIIDFKEGANME